MFCTVNHFVTLGHYFKRVQIWCFEDPHIWQVLILVILDQLLVYGIIFLPRNVQKRVLILAFWVVLAKIAKFSTHLK